MNVLALCSGVGGLELGLRLAEPAARVVCHVERDAYAAAVLVARMADQALDPAPIWDDLATFDGRSWRGVVDCVAAGFPCQPVSLAGKGLAQADDRWLWPHVERVIRETRPGWVFLENVPGLIRRGLADVLSGLAILGFDAEWNLFSAAEEGAPHLRRRLFVLAAHPDRRRREGERSGGILDSERSAFGDDVDGCRGEVPYADGSRLPQRQGKRSDSRPQRAPLIREGWWATEPDVGRVADGMAYRVDRLRAIGNGVVPAVAARAWTELSEAINRR